MPNDSEVVTPQSAFLGLLPLALNAALQRSGADHFPGDHLSPSRTSPFICNVDIIVTIVWMVYGLWHNLGWQASARLLTKDFGIADDQEDKILFGAPTTIFMVFIIIIAVISQSIKMIGIGATGTVPWLQTYATVIFLLAYLLRLGSNTLSRYYDAESADQEVKVVIENTSARDDMFIAVDVLYCVAYTLHFRLWITTFSKLGFFQDFRTDSAGVAIPLVLLTAGASVAWPGYFQGFWSLRKWGVKEWESFALVLFILMLVVPAEHTWKIIATPLTAFGIVVLHLGLVSLIGRTIQGIETRRGRKRGPAKPQAETDQAGLDDATLSRRWSPLLRSASHWRQVLSFAFAASNFTFTVIYYFSIYDPAGTIKPGWTSKLG